MGNLFSNFLLEVSMEICIFAFERDAMKRILLHLMLMLLPVLPLQAEEWMSRTPFRHIGVDNGLSSNSILHILQLRDGRMAFTTEEDINIYDGSHFRYIHLRQGHGQIMSIPNYEGAYHVYQDRHNLLWIKGYGGTLRCFDLCHFCYVNAIDSVFLAREVTDSIRDIFCDDSLCTWVLVKERLCRLDEPHMQIALQQQGTLQDLVVRREAIYLFYSNGLLAAHDTRTGKLIYTSQPFSEAEMHAFRYSSLALSAGEGSIQQVRTGPGGSIWLRFDTKQRSWSRIGQRDFLLHTLDITPDGTAYLTSAEDFYILYPDESVPRVLPTIHLEKGDSIRPKAMNTIFVDDKGGLWLGSYSDGLYYSHSSILHMRGAAATGRLLLTGVSVEGVRLQVGDARLPLSESYTREVKLPCNQRKVELEFSQLNYSVPTLTTYFYRVLDGKRDTAWTEASCGNQMVDANGVLHLKLVNLSRGETVVQVTANPDDAHSPVSVLTLHVARPLWGYLLMVILGVLLLCVLLYIIINRRGKRTVSQSVAKLESLPDTEFLKQATQLVEQNLCVRGYGVEQLSRDLCMERTGLYKKLKEQAGITPSNFIHGIRMHRAIGLLHQGLTVTEVAEKAGFSNASHLSKCFQQDYGCTPTEYLQKDENQQL